MPGALQLGSGCSSRRPCLEVEGLPPALCACFFLRQLADEVRGGASFAASSRWCDPHDDGLGASVCEALRSIRSDVAASCGAACTSLDGSDAQMFHCQLQERCDWLLAEMKATRGGDAAEKSLHQAVEELLDVVDCASQPRSVGSTCSGELPSWCDVIGQGGAPDTYHQIQRVLLADAVAAYCKALAGAFEVAEHRALRPPSSLLSAPLPPHLQHTTAEIGKTVTKIRTAIACGNSALVSPHSLLCVLRQDLERLVAQAEAADDTLSPGDAALRSGVDTVCRAAEVFVANHDRIEISPLTPEKQAGLPTRLGVEVGSWKQQGTISYTEGKPVFPCSEEEQTVRPEKNSVSFVADSASQVNKLRNGTADVVFGEGALISNGSVEATNAKVAPSVMAARVTCGSAFAAMLSRYLVCRR